MFLETPILYVIPHLHKGSKMLSVQNQNLTYKYDFIVLPFSIINDGLTYKAINNNLPPNSTISKDIINIDFDHHFLFQNYVVFVKNNVLMITSFENISSKLLSCEFVEDLVGVYFDSFNFLLYVVLKKGTLLFVSPKFSVNNNPNSNSKSGYCESKNK